MRKLTFIITGLLILGSSIHVHAQTVDPAVGVHGPHFVDLDGDGLRDDAPDLDGDGIPNGMDEDYDQPRDGSGEQDTWAYKRSNRFRKQIMKGIAARAGSTLCLNRAESYQRHPTLSPFGMGIRAGTDRGQLLERRLRGHRPLRTQG
jgi:hypothetical protein